MATANQPFILCITSQRTLFSLGPKKNSLLILCALDEKFKPQSEGKWTAKIALQLHQLQQEWNVLQFRHCIMPFYLHHSPFSKYEGKFIMNQFILIPVLFLEDSEDINNIIRKYYAITYKLGKSHFLGDTELNAIMMRSSYARMFA